MINKKNNIKVASSILIGIVLFFYWFYPVYRDQHYWNYLDRTNDFGGLLAFPIFIIHSIGMISSYSFVVGILIVGFIISWTVLSWLLFRAINY